MEQAKRIQLNTAQNPLKKVVENEAILPVLDTELLIRQAFDVQPNDGMSLLFDHYYPLLCSHAVRFVLSKNIAEDIVSDIFYEFHAQQRYLHITVSYRAFLFTAVRNRSFDYLKSELRRRVPLEDAPLIVVKTEQLPDAITQYEELYQDFQKAINAMPLKRKQIYLMHRFEGKKYQEISTELAVSLRTVETHIYQGVKQIREILQDKWLVLVAFWVSTLG